jgi:Icc-related predicted phosphoesterase
VKILAVSDVELPQMQNAEHLRDTYSDVDMLISCGDMSAHYLDFIGSVLCRPMYYVRGNHDTRYNPPEPGGINLHLTVKLFNGFSFAGLEGSIRYNDGAIQYTEGDMLINVLRLMPRLMLRLARKGYGVNVLVAHSPPKGIHDVPEDYAHRGFRSFCLLMRWARPQYLIHGHVDTWDRRKPRETVFFHTTVLNINPYMVVELG